ncbi:hypothetical protein PIB30_025274 [Stylosanthes scabra]|uniref:Uncharacterized protein n=1 Tax=Stylosanthes scabra TaxID=79078 RepID=A0ABU6U9G8_9FABA|nr:hypothetical protein [Stylosanthes scabra]
MRKWMEYDRIKELGGSPSDMISHRTTTSSPPLPQLSVSKMIILGLPVVPIPGVVHMGESKKRDRTKRQNPRTVVSKLHLRHPQHHSMKRQKPPLTVKNTWLTSPACTTPNSVRSHYHRQ